MHASVDGWDWLWMTLMMGFWVVALGVVVLPRRAADTAAADEAGSELMTVPRVCCRVIYPIRVCILDHVTVTEITYTVPDMSCGHCKDAVQLRARRRSPASSRVDVDLDTKLVIVRGDELDDAALRAAIDEAGYEAA